jgi:hypothetical protein
MVEVVTALGRADEGGPALTICQHGADDFRPSRWVHVPVFVEDTPVQVGTTQPVVVVGARQADTSLVMSEFNIQLRLIQFHPWYRRREPLDVEPGHILGLVPVRRDVGIAPVDLLAPHGLVDQVHDA